MVSVVDAFNFYRNLKSVEQLKDRKEEKAAKDDERNIVNLLIEQIEFANVILINKTDLVSVEELAKIEGVVRILNPSARIFKTVRSKIPLKEIFDTKLFDFDVASTAPGWLQHMRGSAIPETIEYGITSFMYRARRPFHPKRFHELLYPKSGVSNIFEPVWRSKGFVWIASRDKYLAEFEKAGVLYELDGADLWFCEKPEDEWEEAKDMVKKDFEPGVGDKRQELVFMGSGMDEKAVKAALDSCLLNDDEWKLGAEKWKEFEDPLDEWDVMFDGDEDDDEEDDDADDLSDLDDDDESDDDDDDDENADIRYRGHAHNHHGHGHSHKKQ
jgi:G3E family GTPase